MLCYLLLFFIWNELLKSISIGFVIHNGVLFSNKTLVKNTPKRILENIQLVYVLIVKCIFKLSIKKIHSLDSTNLTILFYALTGITYLLAFVISTHHSSVSFHYSEAKSSAMQQLMTFFLCSSIYPQVFFIDFLATSPTNYHRTSPAQKAIWSVPFLKC